MPREAATEHRPSWADQRLLPQGAESCTRPIGICGLDQILIVEELLVISCHRRQAVPDEITFMVNGMAHKLARTDVSAALRRVAPEPIRAHGVIVDGTPYPVKQAFAVFDGNRPS